jgi:hypothetical protein
MPDPFTPTQELSTVVVDCLVEKELVRADRRDALILKISSGEMKGADWQREISLARGDLK